MDPQAEFVNHGIDVIKYIRLNAFIFRPHHGVGEAVNLNRQAAGVRRQLANHQRHIFADARMITQILLQIGAEGADIGHPALIQYRLIGGVLLVPQADFLMT